MTTEAPKLQGTRPQNAFLVEPEKLVIVGLDTNDGKKHPLYDERVFLPLNEALVKNVMVYGVIEPVVVRKTVNDIVEVIDGRQRVRAAREANRRFREAGRDAECLKVMIVTKKGENSHLLSLMISSQENRQDDSPPTKARKANRLIELGKSDVEAAEAFGVSVGTLRGWLKLLDLTPELLAEVEQGHISASHAVQVVKAPVSVQEKVASKARANPTKNGRPRGSPTMVPSKKRIRTKIAAIKENRAAAAALLWAIGDIDDAAFDKALRGDSEEAV